MQSHIRRQILAERKALMPTYIDHFQPIFNERLIAFISQYSSVSMYSAIRNEISVNCVTECLLSEHIALPKINSNDELVFVNYEDPSLWQAGLYGILEPTTPTIDFLPEAFIVPLTAIDHLGTRVGMGKGYYDRYLQTIQDCVTLIGVGWDFQLVDVNLPRQSHDVPMHYFISPSHFIKF